MLTTESRLAAIESALAEIALGIRAMVRDADSKGRPVPAQLLTIADRLSTLAPTADKEPRVDASLAALLRLVDDFGAVSIKKGQNSAGDGGYRVLFMHGAYFATGSPEAIARALENVP